MKGMRVKGRWNMCVTFPMLLAAAILQMVATEGLVRYLPSPLTTSVQPEEQFITHVTGWKHQQGMNGIID